MASSLGSLVVSLGLNAAEFIKGMTAAEYKAKTTAAKLGKDLGKAAGEVALGFGVAAAAMAVFTKQSINAADHISKLSQSTGIGTEELSALAYAGDLANVPIEALATSVSRFNRNIYDATRGTGDAGKAFTAMGISIKDANGNLKSADQLIAEVADKFAGYEDGVEKSAIAMLLFGKAGAQMIPLLNAGGEGLRQMKEEAKQLGLTIDSETGKAAEQFNDNLTRLGAAARGLGNTMMRELLPTLVEFSDKTVDAAKDGGALHQVAKDIATFLKTDAIDAVKVFVVGVVSAAFGFRLLGEMIGSTAAQLAELVKAQIAWATFDYSGAIAGLGRVFEIGRDRSERFRKDLDETSRFVKNVMDFKFSTSKPVLGDTEDLVGIGRQRQRAPGLKDESAAKAVEQFNAALASLQDARAQREIAQFRDQTQHQLQMLDERHGAFLISERDYWGERYQITTAALAREIEAATTQITELERRRDEERKKHGLRSKEYIDAVAKVEAAEAQRSQLSREFGQQQELLWFKAQRAADDYRRTVEELDAQLAQLRGDEVGAARIRQGLQNERLRAQFTANNDQDALRKLDEAERLTMAQVEFNAARDKSSEITARLAIEEERIQNSLRTGAISELEALAKTDEARKKALATMEQQVVAQEAIARASQNPALILQAEQARAALERLRAESNLLADKFNQIFSSAGSQFLTDVITRTKTAKEAFKDFGNTVVNEITRMVSEALSKRLFAAIFGDGNNGGIGGGGGIGGFIGGILGGLFKFDTGTSYVPRTGPYLLHQGEAVTPSAQVRGGWGGDMSVINNFYFSGPVDKRTQQQLSVVAGQGVQRALTRDS